MSCKTRKPCPEDRDNFCTEGTECKNAGSCVVVFFYPKIRLSGGKQVCNTLTVRSV